MPLMHSYEYYLMNFKVIKKSEEFWSPLVKKCIQNFAFNFLYKFERFFVYAPYFFTRHKIEINESIYKPSLFKCKIVWHSMDSKSRRYRITTKSTIFSIIPACSWTGGYTIHMDSFSNLNTIFLSCFIPAMSYNS